VATISPAILEETLRTLPGDTVRQLQRRFAERYDLQMLVQAAREVERGLANSPGRSRHRFQRRCAH
jgi:hypothetical protein